MSDGDDFADYGENGDGEDTLAPKKAAAQQNYGPIIEHIFAKHHTEGALEVPFHRDEIVTSAQELGLKRPSNLGDVLYSFRYRRKLPESVTAKAPPGRQ
ncbi:MAG: hypothetical protein KDB70_03945, partial [Mycobacterium sp.]|nr:hypothetical protein [Mycobacterium sp.]